MTYRQLSFAFAFILACGCTESRPAEERNAASIRASFCEGRQLGNELLAWTHLRAADSPTCEALAPDCETYFECHGVDTARPCEFGVAYCDGDTAVTCGSAGYIREERCEGPNARCALGEYGVPHCTSDDQCDDRTSHCDSNEIVQCVTGLAERWPCGERTCVESERRAGLGEDPTRTQRYAFCADAVEPCEGYRCEGDTLVQCVDGIAVLRQDCDVLFQGSHCTTEDEEPACRRPVIECEEGARRCVEDTAQICVRGGWESFHCDTFENGHCLEMGGDLYCAS